MKPITTYEYKTVKFGNKPDEIPEKYYIKLKKLS